MFIVVNKNFSIANITPSTVYQGSNLANELAIFAPFSISSYSAVEIAVMLPSGEYLTPSLAFPSAEQPDGFGAWSMLLPASVTAIPGTVRLSLSFIGANNAKMVTEAAEFTVNASIPSVPPEPPSQDIYEQILGYVSDVLNRKPDWNQTNVNSPDYIINKPPISKTPTGVEVTGTLTVDGVAFSDKLDKVNNSSYTERVYATANGEQIMLTVGFLPTPGGIPKYDTSGNLATETPNFDADAVNLKYFRNNIVSNINYNGANGVLSLAKADGTVIASVDLPLEMTVSNAEYDESAGALVLTFTSGDTVSIPLADLLLPEWVTNLENIPNGSENVPPTSEAVLDYIKNNTANAIIGQDSGKAILIDDRSPFNMYATVTSTTVTSVLKYGRNLANSGEATPYAGGTVTGDSATGTVEWSAGRYYANVPCYIPAGTAFCFNFDLSDPDNLFARVIFFDANGAEVYRASDGAKSGIVAAKGADIVNMRFYKTSPTTAFTGSITFSNIAVNVGAYCFFSPFTSPASYNLNNGTNDIAIPYPTPATRGATLVIPQNSPANASISVSYTRDSTIVINNLNEKIEALQNALAQ